MDSLLKVKEVLTTNLQYETYQLKKFKNKNNNNDEDANAITYYPILFNQLYID